MSSFIDTAALSTKQIEKARAAIATKMKKARADFIAANPDYQDIVIDRDIQLLVAAFSRGKQGVDIQLDPEMAKVRYDLTISNPEQLKTFDLLTVKTEKDIDEGGKYKMTAWLPAKRYRVDGTVWKQGFCDPELEFKSADANRFITVDLDTFQVLRAKGLLQLMSDEEIETFASELKITSAMYFKLFF